jgi:hypothetical protein
MLQQEEVPTSPQNRRSPLLQPLVGGGQLRVKFRAWTNAATRAPTAAAAIHVGLVSPQG